MSELVLMCGVPRSGKSTLAKDIQLQHGHLIVCPDQLRTLIFGHVFRQETEPLVWFLAEAIIRLVLNQGFSVILDATNTHEKSIYKWKRVAQDLNINCRVLVVDTPFDVISVRNQGKNSVPTDVLTKMSEQFNHFKQDILPSLLTQEDNLTVEVYTNP